MALMIDFGAVHLAILLAMSLGVYGIYRLTLRLSSWVRHNAYRR